MTDNENRVSFRDPDGFVIFIQNEFYRIVYLSYAEELKILEENNFFNDTRILKHDKIPNQEWPTSVRAWIEKNEDLNQIHSIFKLEKIYLITYPWEWTPSMLKDAALLTLEIQKDLIPLGLTLKDANCYNVQFINSRAIFIDLLSFKKVDIFYPWFAYGQFLRHFTFPMTLLKYGRINILPFFRSYPDGIEVELVSAYIPFLSYFNAFELLNVHFLSKLKVNSKDTQKTYELKIGKKVQIQKLEALIDFNSAYIQKINLYKRLKKQTIWNNYSEEVDKVYSEKKSSELIKLLLTLPNLESCLDLGANSGNYSEILSNYCKRIISIEQDYICCELIRKKILLNNGGCQDWSILVNDLLFPSSSCGWMNKERLSLFDRVKSDLVVSFALLHHIFFSGSINFHEISKMFKIITKQYLIIEFIEPNDPMVVLLALRNPSRVQSYNKENFLEEFLQYFTFIVEQKITGTRSLFLLKLI
jgi:hypothetical protein